MKAVGHVLEHEDLLFADAEEIVVEGCAGDDVGGGLREIAGAVDHDGRIAGAGADGAFAGGIAAATTIGPPVTQRRRMCSFFVSALNVSRWAFDGADEIFDTEDSRAIASLKVRTARPRSARRWMRVEDDGVAGGDDVDDVAAEVGMECVTGGDGADDAEGRVLLHRDAVIAAHAVAAGSTRRRGRVSRFRASRSCARGGRSWSRRTPTCPTPSRSWCKGL
jgi:hypothetical protein